MLTAKDKEKLIQLICEKQTAMISYDHGSFVEEDYIDLEKLKIKLKGKEVTRCVMQKLEKLI